MLADILIFLLISFCLRNSSSDSIWSLIGILYYLNYETIAAYLRLSQFLFAEWQVIQDLVIILFFILATIVFFPFVFSFKFSRFLFIFSLINFHPLFLYLSDFFFSLFICLLVISLNNYLFLNLSINKSSNILHRSLSTSFLLLHFLVIIFCYCCVLSFAHIFFPLILFPTLFFLYFSSCFSLAIRKYFFSLIGFSRYFLFIYFHFLYSIFLSNALPFAVNECLSPRISDISLCALIKANCSLPTKNKNFYSFSWIIRDFVFLRWQSCFGLGQLSKRSREIDAFYASSLAEVLVLFH